MLKTVFLNASGDLFLIAVALLAFTFYYFHFSKENGLPGIVYHKKTNKPFVSMLFGVLGTVILASSIFCLVFSFVMQD